SNSALGLALWQDPSLVEAPLPPTAGYVDESVEADERRRGPTELDDLLFGEVATQAIEHTIVDRLMIEGQTFGEIRGRLLSSRQRLILRRGRQVSRRRFF